MIAEILITSVGRNWEWEGWKGKIITHASANTIRTNLCHCAGTRCCVWQRLCRKAYQNKKEWKCLAKWIFLLCLEDKMLFKEKWILKSRHNETTWWKCINFPADIFRVFTEWSHPSEAYNLIEGNTGVKTMSLAAGTCLDKTFSSFFVIESTMVRWEVLPSERGTNTLGLIKCSCCIVLVIENRSEKLHWCYLEQWNI